MLLKLENDSIEDVEDFGEVEDDDFGNEDLEDDDDDDFDDEDEDEDFEDEDEE